jgi:hypothetical protein
MRRVRRGVGMKGMGRIMTRIVVRMESARVRVLYAVKCAVGFSWYMLWPEGWRLSYLFLSTRPRDDTTAARKLERE